MRAFRLWNSHNLLLRGYWRLSLPWVKWPGREADHWPPYSDEVKNKWRSIYTFPYTFLAYTGTALFEQFVQSTSLFLKPRIYNTSQQTLTKKKMDSNTWGTISITCPLIRIENLKPHLCFNGNGSWVTNLAILKKGKVILLQGRCGPEGG